jgi:hypothetical protein
MMITPLEEHVLKAQDFVAGLAAMAQYREMLRQDAECALVSRDHDQPTMVRAEALKESRRLNQAFELVAVARAACGISA